MAAYASRARALCAAVLLPLLAITCDSPTSPSSASTGDLRAHGGSASIVTSVSVKLLLTRIAIGSASFASARAIDENGNQLTQLFPSSWTSSNPGVATVSSTGFVRGVGNGTA